MTLALLCCSVRGDYLRRESRGSFWWFSVINLCNFVQLISIVFRIGKHRLKCRLMVMNNTAYCLKFEISSKSYFYLVEDFTRNSKTSKLKAWQGISHVTEYTSQQVATLELFELSETKTLLKAYEQTLNGNSFGLNKLLRTLSLCTEGYMFHVILWSKLSCFESDFWRSCGLREKSCTLMTVLRNILWQLPEKLITCKSSHTLFQLF